MDDIMNDLILILTGVAGSVLTFCTSTYLKQGAVRASALLSLIVALFFHIFPSVCNSYLTIHIPMVFIGASFIGMVSTKTNVNYFHLILAGCLFSIIYTYKDDVFSGYGGALGTIAGIALLTSFGISALFSKNSYISKRFSKLTPSDDTKP
ncbi:hypothetical protein FNJ87_00295 [Nonlabens mediterrranea]|uniref:DUF4203 domain-containing protein n=1 Tax=Nonlabens mediterrranea TaxID=1419947 RepID=A0ABS0A150_9FLAO|nr:hypothetical protein [Nonlabens mediterrranea]